MEKEQHEDIAKLLRDESAKGNVIFNSFAGLQITPLNEFVNQGADGLLYDLNRGEEVSLTFVSKEGGEKWINDYAVALVIRELKTRLDKLNA